MQPLTGYLWFKFLFQSPLYRKWLNPLIILSPVTKLKLFIVLAILDLFIIAYEKVKYFNLKQEKGRARPEPSE